MLIANTEIIGHKIRMLCRAAALLSELKALAASIYSIPSVSSASKIASMACMAASLPDFWPANSWREPSLATFITHFASILLKLHQHQ